MPSAKFCNSRPASAAVVASFDSVLYCCTDSVLYRTSVCMSDLEIDRMDWVQTLLQNTSHSHHHSSGCKTVSHRCPVDFVHAATCAELNKAGNCEKCCGRRHSHSLMFHQFDFATVAERAPLCLYTLCNVHTVHCTMCSCALEHSANAQHSVHFSEKCTGHSKQLPTWWSAKLPQAVRAKTLRLGRLEFIVYVSTAQSS